jgi:tetratricopeptide (TPR) repeat protein
LDVCPVGPLVPTRELCLNCGTRYLSDAADVQCQACGQTRRACPAALGLADSPGDDCVSAARAAFAQGLFRRGLAVLNQALQEGRESLEPWFLKAGFLNSLGFNRTAAEMLGGALAKYTRAADRILLLEEQTFLWAECQRGEEALTSADAAVGLGSDSVRTHYLRGRALALLGRLEAARDEMNRVLTLDPNYADARRALGMIEAACPPPQGKHWWQFWKR